MITVRYGTFETNSSSTHSMVICTEDEWNKWVNGELFASRWKSGFKTKEELIQECKQEYSYYFDGEGNFITNDRFSSLEEFMEYYSDGWYNLDRWVGNLESDETTYKTPNGETLKIICRYGYDG